MIDLTPLDVRKKRGDFGRGLRGYDAQEVDTFLDLVAERLEQLVKENLQLRERSERLQEQVASQQGREQAVNEALVTAQELRREVREQADREAALLRREAETDARRIVREAEQQVLERKSALEELERKRLRFLRNFRTLLERELDGVVVEEGRQPLEDVEVELDLGGGREAPWKPTLVRDEEARAGDAERRPLAPVEAQPAEPVPPGFVVEEDRPAPDADVHALARAAGTSEGDEVGLDAGNDQAAGDEGGPAETPSDDGAPTPYREGDLWLNSILEDEDDDGRERRR